MPEPGPEMGDAVPIDSPNADNPDGEVIELGEVDDLVHTGGTYGVRIGDELLVGTLDELHRDPKTVDVAGCTDLSANAGEILVTCGSEIRAVGGEAIALEEPAETAVKLSDGTIVAASATEPRVWIYEGEEIVDEFDVAGPTHELAVTDTDKVVRINREKTTIQDVRVSEGRQGGTLRAGIGIGTMSTGPDGVVVASDTSGDQLLVYTVSDVIRLHQTTPVADSPYAVAHDGHLAWIASTGTNTATAYDFTRGVPMEESTVNTIADVRALVATPDGLVFGGADGLQIVDQPGR